MATRRMKCPKRNSNLRLQAFSIYRRLFSVVFLTNIGIFISYAIRRISFSEDRTGCGCEYLYRYSHEAGARYKRAFCSCLFGSSVVSSRFPTVLAGLLKGFLRWPFFIRKTAARVYHNGGVHSGAAVSGTVWLILLAVQATRGICSRQRGTSVVQVIVHLIINVLFIHRLQWPPCH